MKCCGWFPVLPMALTLLVSSGLGQTSIAPPAVPALLPYASVALSAGGQPLRGPLGVSFAIYKAQQGGEPLWSETQTVSFDPAGYFKVQLGATSLQGIPPEMFSAAEARWLQVHIEGQDQTPRILMASVPYALKAADASTLGGLPASAFLRADGASAPRSDASVEADTAAAKRQVSSVGLSAPSSDFTITGSPVTTAGTLGLHWSVAPTSQDEVNAIVKRDQHGDFAADEVVANGGLTAVATHAMSAVTGIDKGSGIGVFGISSQGSGVVGDSAASVGVQGVTASAAGSGVAGVNNGGGPGVVGQGNVGVIGYGSPYSFATDSNVTQPIPHGGWVKAMAFINAETPPYSITRCFNSSLAGPAATTPPCGLDLVELQPGWFDLSDANNLVIHSFALVTFGRRFNASRVEAGVNDLFPILDIQTTGTKSSIFNDPDYEGAEYSIIFF